MELYWSRPVEVLLCHTNFKETLLCQNCMLETSPVASPLNPDVDMSENTCRLTDYESHEYRSNIGSLLYLATKTRPDLCLSASILGLHVAEPTKPQLTGDKDVLRYLIKTQNHWMKLHTNEGSQLSAHIGSNCGAEPGTKRSSMTGIIVVHGMASIYITSILQKGALISSTEAGYLALSEACKIFTYLLQVLHELIIEQKPTQVMWKNSAINWPPRDPSKYYSEWKYIDIRFNYVMKMAAENNTTVRK